MRRVAGVFLLAIVLFAAGAACWTEARLARRMALAHERLATLQYDTEDDIDAAMTTVNRLPWPGGSSGGDIERHRATMSYWRSDYRELMGSLPSAGGNVTEGTSNPEVLLVAANAAFRASQAGTLDRAATIDRLDRVIQAYADVLRLAPDSADASFNYEYVSRFRDGFARSKPQDRGARGGKPVAVPAGESTDLPAGPTVHGYPGFPPPSTGMERFKTITPMRFDEREEGDPGRGGPRRRKG
jgi:hypothetical protein